MTEYVLYHMHLKDHEDTSDGYIGVTSNLAKRKWRHLNDPVNDKTAHAILIGVEFTVLHRGSKEECLELEKMFRPFPDIGWNCRVGGLEVIHSTETIEKMSVSKIGNCNAGSGEHHHFHGKTGESSIRYGTKGEKHPLHKGFWVTPFGRFGSQSLAADAEGCAKSTIYYRCKVSTSNPDYYFEEN